MTDQKHHDSLAPKGAFTTTDAADDERAAASTATLVASQSDRDADAHLVDEPRVTLTISADEEDDDLCADELIPSNGERVSMENAMRTLIEMRLEQTRPSDDFGTFDLAPTATASEPRAAQATAYQPAMNSLAPIELAPLSPALDTTNSDRKVSPFPYLAATAIILFGVGLYRRADRDESSATRSAAAAAVDATTATPMAPVNAEAIDTPQEIAPLAVSESDDAILTLGTPTIVYVQEDAAEEDVEAHEAVSAGPSTRAVKETQASAPSVARAARVAQPKQARALPEAPTREDIVAGFNSVRAEVLACANGAGGVAPIEATVIGSGRITHANVGGYYQGTPAGSCIARVLRKARFAEFSGESITVSFPYTL